jgi:hypothetical protein
MTPILWIGLSFLIVLVIFLIITFFIKDSLTSAQYNTLRFLTTLCAGFAGGFLTGDALFRLDTEMTDGVKIGVSGTAGCALFFTIWFTYPKHAVAIPKNAFNLSIPDGWTFEMAINRIVKAAQGVYEVKGFSKEQLVLVLNSAELKTPSAVDAIKRLRYLCQDLPEYTVSLIDDIYKIEKV